jgi:hypothetical protein
MDHYGAIEQRYGFVVPEVYRTLEAQGHLGLPWRNYLAFYDCEWLKLEKIVQYKFNDWEIAVDGGFVPFAITGRHEPYCWRLDWASGGEPPIVLCKACESGICLAPDLRGFLYRMAIEAFAGRNDFLGDARVDELRRAVDIIASLLPARWARQLRELQHGNWQKDEKRAYLFIIPPQECDIILAKELSFLHLNEEFIHDKEYLNRHTEEGK